MISLDEYLINPCGMLSIPFWKAKSISLTDNMLIVHDSCFSSELLKGYIDESYFRLYHKLETINQIYLHQFDIVTAKLEQIDDIVTLINISYNDLQVDRKQIEGYTKTSVYDPTLWILVLEKDTGKIVGGGIADYDKEAHELILEWIQVLPDYRGKGIGQAIVNELLYRMQGKADFATVSGKINSDTNPELLYRKCGFIGHDIWHVLQRK